MSVGKVLYERVFLELMQMGKIRESDFLYAIWATFIVVEEMCLMTLVGFFLLGKEQKEKGAYSLCMYSERRAF